VCGDRDITIINTFMANIPKFFATFIASLGSAAFLNVGTGANKVVQLNSGGGLPALDAALLLNLPSNPNTVGDYKFNAKSANHGMWLLCNGQTVSRTTYSALFAEIGTSFGVGDGSTTFTLPNGMSCVPGTIGQRSGLSNRTLGQFVGAETHTLTTAQLPSHRHSILSDSGSGIGSGSSTDRVLNNTDGAVRNVASGRDTELTGSGQALNIMQPTLFIGNMFIYCNVQV